MVKLKTLNLLLILSSLFGLLEWGGGNSEFLFRAEFSVIKGLITDPSSSAHPFTLIPLLGQLLLLITLFQKQPGRLLTYGGISCLGFLLGFLFLIGLAGLNFRIVFSTLPFLLLSVITVRKMKKEVQQ